MVKYDETEDDEENPPDYRGMRQLQQQYQWSHECLDAGAAAYAKRKYRAAVDLYAAAYRHSGGSSGSFSFRYYCVYMVTNGLTQTDLNATEKDIRFLKEVLADENEEHASRVRVAVVLGASPSPHKAKRERPHVSPERAYPPVLHRRPGYQHHRLHHKPPPRARDLRHHVQGPARGARRRPGSQGGR